MFILTFSCLLPIFSRDMYPFKVAASNKQPVKLHKSQAQPSPLLSLMSLLLLCIYASLFLSRLCLKLTLNAVIIEVISPGGWCYLFISLLSILPNPNGGWRASCPPSPSASLPTSTFLFWDLIANKIFLFVYFIFYSSFGARFRRTPKSQKVMFHNYRKSVLNRRPSPADTWHIVINWDILEC